MSSELYRHVFKENGLEKPTQNQFNHLSHYLVNIIDHQVSSSLPWPLYDTKTERAYRHELASFISDYSSKGLLTSIMSSYLVNPGCYKVTILIFQLSQLAVQRVLIPKINKDCKKKLYSKVCDKYKSQKDGFIEYIENETKIILTKFSNYICKRQMLEKIAELLRSRISEMEAKLEATNSQNYINNLVEVYINKYNPDEIVREELLKIKNVKEPFDFFDMWLTETDNVMQKIECNWESLIVPLLRSANSAHENSKALIGRHTGEIDRSLFTVEYNPQTDAIRTEELQCLVNSEQKYILKNIEKDGRLSFPNLVRSFIIAICFILKNNEIGDEIYKFNEYLDGGLGSYSELTSAMKMVNERVLNAETKLQVAPMEINHSLSSKEAAEIPPLPDLSNLKAHRDGHFLFESFTPLNLTKHQFNLRRKVNSNFIKPQSKSLLITQFSAPRDDFLKTLISCRVSTYDRPNSTQNLHNLSMISQANKANETIAECSSGFTKQQILRLLSTKKSSSSKKFKYKTERPDIKVKKGGLFNESIASNESSGLFRSYSSPNLFENREKRPVIKGRARKLSIMQEDSPNSILEVSGIATLDKNSNFSTPKGIGGLEDAKFELDQPIISISKDSEKRINSIFNNMQEDLNKEIGDGSIGSEISHNERNSIELPELKTKTETPKTNAQLIRKTSSLEKIINRFKKVRANVLSTESFESPKNIKTIVEERENNYNTVNVDGFTANRTLLPDLINPSFNAMPNKTVNYYDDFCLDMDEKEQQPRRPRESLGTALGVDQTFLDQFDLID